MRLDVPQNATTIIEWADAQEEANAVFLMIFAWVVSTSGEPDFPASHGTDWRAVLSLKSPLMAVWDFDYYQLSLRVACEDDPDRVVILAKHTVDAPKVVSEK